MSKGGVAFKVNLEKVGRFTPAKKDSYKRVYDENGTTFSYPKVDGNRLRTKGVDYFIPKEINGSKEGTEKNPKFSLLKHFIEKEIPLLDELAAKVSTETNKRVMIRYQINGAAPISIQHSWTD